MNGIIYKCKNKINGKFYIGQTTQNLDKRKQQHFSRKMNLPFINALNKYGKKNFKWEVIEECKTKNELDELEFHYIKQYNSLIPNGYNLTTGGNGTSGYIHSEKSKENMGKSQIKRFLNNNERKKLSIKQKELWLNDEYRKNQTIQIKKTWCNEHNINYNTFYYYKNKNKSCKGYFLKLIE